MIVVLSYWSSENETPGLKFFPVNKEQSALLAAHLVDCMDVGKNVQVYELVSINEEARQICISGPQPQGDK